MRTRSKWMIGALIAIVFPAIGNAMQNEPEDFLGIEWGARLESHRSTLRTITESGESGHYRRLSDQLTFAGVDVRRISYHFYKGRFISGSYLSVGANELKRILALLTRRYGEPTSSHPRHKIYVWEGAQRGVSVSCDITISCFTEFYDKELRDMELAEEASLQRSSNTNSDMD